MENIDTDVQLTEEEQAVEKACDEERYLELHTDLQEAAMYEGEMLMNNLLVIQYHRNKGEWSVIG